MVLSLYCQKVIPFMNSPFPNITYRVAVKDLYKTLNGVFFFPVGDLFFHMAFISFKHQIPLLFETKKTTKKSVVFKHIIISSSLFFFHIFTIATRTWFSIGAIIIELIANGKRHYWSISCKFIIAIKIWTTAGHFSFCGGKDVSYL